MFRIGKATDAVEESANAVTALANSANAELSDLSAQLRMGARIAPILVIGTAIVSVVALILAVAAVTRRP